MQIPPDLSMSSLFVSAFFPYARTPRFTTIKTKTPSWYQRRGFRSKWVFPIWEAIRKVALRLSLNQLKIYNTLKSYKVKIFLWIFLIRYYFSRWVCKKNCLMCQWNLGHKMWGVMYRGIHSFEKSDNLLLTCQISLSLNSLHLICAFTRRRQVRGKVDRSFHTFLGNVRFSG
jgi:hypothetical protein